MYIGGAIGCVDAVAGSPATAGGALARVCDAVRPLYGRLATSFFDVGSTIFIASSCNRTLTVCSAFRACRSTSLIPLKLFGAFFSAAAAGAAPGAGAWAAAGVVASAATVTMVAIPKTTARIWCPPVLSVPDRQ